MFFVLLLLLLGCGYTIAWNGMDDSEESYCGGELSQSERNQLLQVHNSVRSKIALGHYRNGWGSLMPQATNMRKLSYDCGLERSAASVAQQCNFDHSHSYGVGENMYMMSASYRVSRDGQTVSAAQSWLGELGNFEWNSLRFSHALSIGHATQAVWARTSRVGCAAASCNGGSRVIVVCHYKETGNVLGWSVYDAGPTCSACPGGTSCDLGTGLCV